MIATLTTVVGLLVVRCGGGLVGAGVALVEGGSGCVVVVGGGRTNEPTFGPGLVVGFSVVVVVVVRLVVVVVGGGGGGGR